ncbi:hypothetical protein KI387_024998, partial [Taxus chinensis]
MDQTADTMPVSFKGTSYPKGMNRRLYKAAESGNVGELKELIKNKIEVLGEVTSEGNTALHLAAYNGHSQFVEELLKLNKQDSEAGRKQFVTAKNREGNTALHEAAMKGKEEIVKDLLAESPELAPELNCSGETALFKAAEEGHTEVVKRLLLRTPAKFDTRKLDGKTPLHLAVINQHRDVIKELLQQRRDLLQQVDDCGRTPLHMAALIPVATPPTFTFPWDKSKYEKHIRQVGKMLLDEDESLCYRVDIYEQSPLHIAAKEGNAALVEEILNRPNDCVQMVDENGRNALHLAVENAPLIFERVKRSLGTIISNLASRRVINCCDKNGKTPLDIATDVENTNKDPQLFSSIERHLRECGAKKKMLDTKTTSSTEGKWNYEMISVVAALVGTVAFAAAFTLPGGFPEGDPTGGAPAPAPKDSDAPSPVLLKESVFKVFLIFDALAFYHSIASVALLIYAQSRNQVVDPILAWKSIGGMWGSVALTGDHIWCSRTLSDCSQVFMVGTACVVFGDHYSHIRTAIVLPWERKVVLGT